MAPTAPPSVVIVEDHVATRRFLADNLAADGYAPLQAGSASQALAVIAAADPSIAVLDLGLPDRDGLDLIDDLRGTGGSDPGVDTQLPLLVLSGRATEIERVRALRRGADDYLVKPCGYNELRARIDALLRRAEGRSTTGRTRIDTLEIDARGRQVWVEGEAVHLSNKEFALVRMLASEPTRTFTRDELMRDVWGFRSPGATRTLDSHAHRVRRKLSGGRARFVVNVWGVGYRLVDGEASS